MTFITLNVVIILGFLISDLFSSYHLSRTTLAISIGIIEIIALAVVYYLSRKISSRVAGPVYAMERRLKTLADGDVSLHLTLRKDDYFHEVSDIVNESIDTFHEHIEKTKATAKLLKSELQQDSEAYRHVLELIEELEYFSNDNPDPGHSGEGE
jgi:methyl-accepting chemotaxis protein